MKCEMLDCREKVYKGISLGPGTFIDVCRKHYAEIWKEKFGDDYDEKATKLYNNIHNFK